MLNLKTDLYTGFLLKTKRRAYGMPIFVAVADAVMKIFQSGGAIAFWSGAYLYAETP